jgi:hypothetical protein
MSWHVAYKWVEGNSSESKVLLVTKDAKHIANMRECADSSYTLVHATLDAIYAEKGGDTATVGVITPHGEEPWLEHLAVTRGSEKSLSYAKAFVRDMVASASPESPTEVDDHAYYETKRQELAKNGTDIQIFTVQVG